MGFLGKSSRKKVDSDKLVNPKSDEKTPLLKTQISVVNETDDPFSNEIKNMVKVNISNVNQTLFYDPRWNVGLLKKHVFESIKR